MHASPSRFGAEILVSLLKAVHAEGIDLVTLARVVDLYRDRSDRICGVRVQRPDGVFEDVGCRALILACNGYGGNPEMVKKYIPDMAAAHYHGHPSNEGDAIRWGEALVRRLLTWVHFRAMVRSVLRTTYTWAGRSSRKVGYRLIAQA